MAGNTIDAKLVVAADFSDAIRQLQQLRRESQQTGSAVVAVQQAAGRTGAVGAGGAAGGQAGASSTQAQAAADRQAAAERRAALRAQREAEREANRKRIEEEQRVTREVRANTNLQKQAYRQLPAQITDITTSIASGMPVWLVAIQQGGQLKDSFGGVVPAAKALLGLLTPLRVVMSGVALALTALGVGAFQGYRETDRLNKTLALTGNIGAFSIGQLNGLATRLARETGSAIGGIRDTLAALVESGNYTGATIEQAARAVTALRRLTGQSAEEAVQAFESQGDGITQWSIKANRAYNFLTAAQVAYIRRLEAEGRTVEAARFVNEELANTLNQRATPAVGYLERAWKAVGSTLSSVWDTIKGIGRDATPEERLAKLEERLAKLRRNQANARSDNRPGYQQLIQQAQADADALRSQINSDGLRAAERAIQQREENEKILREQKAYQDSLSALNKAEADKRLAALEAALDAEAAAVQAADAVGLARAEDTARKLNGIEQRRLRAREANLRAELEREQARPLDEKDLDGLGKATRVAALEKQLIELQSRIRAVATEGQAIVDAAALDASRKESQAWADVWKRAYDQVRSLADQNAAAQADNADSPQARADRAALVRSTQLRRELADLRRDLDNAVATNQSEPQRAALREQIRQLEAEGAQAVAEQERLGRLGSIVQQVAEAMDALALAERRVDDEVQRGAASAEDAEQRKFDARAAALPQLRALLALQRELASTPGERAAIERLEADLGRLGDRTREVERDMRGNVAGSFRSVFMDFVTGVQNAEQAFKGFIVNVARGALDLIAQRLGMKLAESLLPASGGLLGGIGSFLLNLFHTGGVVGANSMSMTRRLAPAALAGLQVLHTGGIAGMVRPNEQLALLEKGEEVLTADDPRHVANGGGARPPGGAPSLPLRRGGGTGGVNAEDASFADGMARVVKRKVSEGIQDEMRPGGLIATYLGRGR